MHEPHAWYKEIILINNYVVISLNNLCILSVLEKVNWACAICNKCYIRQRTDSNKIKNKKFKHQTHTTRHISTTYIYAKELSSLHRAESLVYKLYTVVAMLFFISKTDRPVASSTAERHCARRCTADRMLSSSTETLPAPRSSSTRSNDVDIPIRETFHKTG